MSAKVAAGFSAVEKLAKTHDLTRFSCGREALDEWLRQHALQSQATDSAKTYVVTHDGFIAGYYSIAGGCIKTEEASIRAAKGQPRAGSVPIALLARLAVDVSAQGKGLGTALLKDALLRCAAAADILAVRAVLVHALDDDAKAFYQRFDFEASPVDDMTLMILMKDVRKILG